MKNNKQTAIDLVLFDIIPISQNCDIKVETGNSRNNEEKGNMEWKVHLKPSDKRILKFSNVINYPKFKRVNL